MRLDNDIKIKYITMAKYINTIYKNMVQFIAFLTQTNSRAIEFIFLDYISVKDNPLYNLFSLVEFMFENWPGQTVPGLTSTCTSFQQLLAC